MTHRFLSYLCFLAGMVAAGLSPSHAQTCGSEYVLKEGESLADVAARAYGASSQWIVIFYANQDRLGANASMLLPGLAIRVPCMPGQTPTTEVKPSNTAPATLVTSGAAGTAETPIEISSFIRRVEFLTADGLTPITDRSLDSGGMLPHLIRAAMEQIKSQPKSNFTFNITWVNDWAAHLSPLLTSRAFDGGFPWPKPDCTKLEELSNESKFRCQRFFFSDPIYETVMALFVKIDSPLTFASDSEMVGKTLCQPAGLSTYELDKAGRNWVKDNKIVLLQPQNIEECFRLLSTGAVDAVVTTDLTGNAVSAAVGMADKVKMLQRPVALVTLHVVVPKNHPHATTLLYYINASIAKLKDTGDYDRIVEEHLAKFWNTDQKGKGGRNGDRR